LAVAPVAEVLIWAVSPAAKVTVLLVLLPLVAGSDIVTDKAVSTPFF
jgi:hypothetical protein